MRSTIISVVLAVLILAGGFGLSRILQDQKEEAPRIPVSKRIPQVRYQRVENRDQSTRVYITGPLTAKDRIDLFSEVTGTYLDEGKPFKEGTYFKEGETMIQVDDEEYQMTLRAAKSALMNQVTLLLPDLKTDYPESFPQWQAYLDSMSLDEPLPPLPEPNSNQERYFISAQNLYNQYYNIRSQETRVDKYTIKAPFNGQVSSSSITEGTLVRTGQKLGEFVNPYVYEMEAAVSLRDLPYLRPGSRVTLGSDDLNKEWKGQVARISDVVDPSTQSAKLFITVSGRDLREGMYLEGYVQGRTIKDVIEIDRSVMNTDSTVMIVDDIYQGSLKQKAAADSASSSDGPQVTRGTLRFFTVEPVQYTKNTVFIQGIPEGTYLVNEPVADAFDGMDVALYQN